ncbi:MAG: selenium metabolism-associated LysR family transcriptional regulator [Lachnospiraceae bacterium]
MKLEHIKSFIGIVNNKSFSAAAKNMFLSQPTISAHIKLLEEELGVQLLVRSTKDVILSEEGLIFYPYAVKLMETENEALAKLHNKPTDIKGEVSITVSSVPAYYVIPYFMLDVRNTYPDITCRIMEEDSSKVVYDILRFNAEIGIGGIKTSNEKVVCEPLFTDEIVLITPNTERYRKLQGVFPTEILKDEDFVVRERGSGTKLAAAGIEKALSLEPGQLRTVVQLNSSEMICGAVETGVGIAFISRLAIQDALAKKSLLEFSFPAVDSVREFYLMYHRDRVLTPVATSVIKSLRLVADMINEKSDCYSAIQVNNSKKP